MKRYSLKAIRRQCPECGKNFKPMTEKQWEFNYWQVHRPFSKRHNEGKADIARED